MDTNTLASGFVGFHRPQSAPGLLLHAWAAGQFDLVLSTHTLQELERTFENAYFREHLTASQVTRALTLLYTEAEIVAITMYIAGIATHPEDDLILGTSVSAQADYLVTGDKQLRKLASYHDVRIIRPAEFLAILTGTT